MTYHDDIDPARAALITERIDQTFNFVRDAIANPRMLEEIPSGSELRFRDVFLEGQQVRLTAFLPKQPGALWESRVSGLVDESLPRHPASAERQPAWIQEGRNPSVAGYETAEAALDALEAEIYTVEQPRPVSRRAVGA